MKERKRKGYCYKRVKQREKKWRWKERNGLDERESKEKGNECEKTKKKRRVHKNVSGKKRI